MSFYFYPLLGVGGCFGGSGKKWMNPLLWSTFFLTLPRSKVRLHIKMSFYFQIVKIISHSRVFLAGECRYSYCSIGQFSQFSTLIGWWLTLPAQVWPPSQSHIYSIKIVITRKTVTKMLHYYAFFSKLDEMKTEHRKTVTKMLHYNAFFSKSDKMKTELRKIVSNVMVFFLIHVKNV